MDRTLVAEFPWFGVGVQSDNVYSLLASDTRPLSSTVFLQEMKLDLSGYVQSDLTVGFRRSFEQFAGQDQIFWNTFNASSDYTTETTIISSVPFNDDQLILATGSSPGFIPFYFAGQDWGNFNRTHIIHGRFTALMPNSTIGSSSYTSSGNATLMKLTDNSFSSLEPTAADCLYCYRVISCPVAGKVPGGASGITQIGLPAKRVILDAFTVEEPDLEYMMRLKRSYELANQV